MKVPRRLNGGNQPKDNWVTNRELASELRSLRWEVRFLIVFVNAAVLIGFKVSSLPSVSAMFWPW